MLVLVKNIGAIGKSHLLAIGEARLVKKESLYPAV